MSIYDKDPVYEKAKLVAMSAEKLCIAKIQRQLMISYNRASRLMDSLIEEGVVERYETIYGGVGYKLSK